MRLHARLPVLAAASVVLLGLASCQQLAGSGKGSAQFVELRTQLAGTREALRKAVGDSDVTRVGVLLPALSTRLDEIEKRSSAMNMLDREHVALEIATLRRTITETDRWVAAGDLDSVRLKISQIDTSLGEIDTILDRTIRGATDASSSS
ncbi:MAG TPA: hypothetical protein VJX91_05575 [Candidatus Eisenbacteria bacterium]|nr:hypothetical protein [Candidatus Eisenbacteria bacterium]